MGIALYVEAMDHAPKDLTSGEKLVLLVIAERGRDDTRIAVQSTRWTMGTLMHRANMGEDGLKTAFKGLARKGCEVRKPLKYGPTGKPIFAYKGVAMSFRLPVFSHGVVIENLNYPEGHPQRGCHSTPFEGAEERMGVSQHPHGGVTAPPLEEVKGVSQHPSGGVTAPPLGPKGGVTAPPSPSKNFPHIPHLSLSAVNSLGAVVDLDERREMKLAGKKIKDFTPEGLVGQYLEVGEEASRFVAAIAKAFRVQTPAAWFKSADSNGTLADRVAEIRGLISAGPRPAAIGPMCTVSDHHREIASTCRICASDAKADPDRNLRFFEESKAHVSTGQASQCSKHPFVRGRCWKCMAERAASSAS